MVSESLELRFGFAGAGPAAPRGEGPDKEPFDVWWRRAIGALTAVPPCVARQWLYDHWHDSPFGPGVDVGNLRFKLEDWAPAQLGRIQRNSHWARDEALQPVANWRAVSGGVVRYVVEHLEWPAPIIVGRTLADFPSLEALFASADRACPILLEGHTRHEVWRSLYAEGYRLPAALAVWVVTVVTPHGLGRMC